VCVCIYIYIYIYNEIYDVGMKARRCQNTHFMKCKRIAQKTMSDIVLIMRFNFEFQEYVFI
jgi:hypothetical protein